MGDVELQRLAAEALGICSKKGDRDAHDGLLQALSSEDLAVRRAVALAMGRLARPGAGDNLATTLSFDDSKDRFLHDGILRGVERLGKPGIAALISLAESGVQKDTDQVVEAFLGLRSCPAFDALPTLLKHMHVVSGQRADLIRSALNYQLDPPVSLEPIVACVASPSRETSAVKKAILEVLGTPGTLKGAKADVLVIWLLADGNGEVRVRAITTAARMRLSKAGPILAKRLEKEDLPASEQLAVIKALRRLPTKEAVPALEKVLTSDKSSAPLRRVAVIAAGATAEGARLVGKLYLEKKLPKGLLPEVSAALAKHSSKDAESAKLLAEVKKIDPGKEHHEEAGKRVHHRVTENTEGRQKSGEGRKRGVALTRFSSSLLFLVFPLPLCSL